MTVIEAYEAMQGHWSVRGIYLLSRPGILLERHGFKRASSLYTRAIGPLWDWLASEQARRFRTLID